MVTQKQIDDARDKVLTGRSLVHLGGYSAASEDELERVVRILMDGGHMENVDSVRAIETLRGPAVSVGINAVNLPDGALDEIGELLANLQPSDLIVLEGRSFADFEHSLEEGATGTEQEGMFRDVYVSPWRTSAEFITPEVLPSAPEASLFDVDEPASGLEETNVPAQTSTETRNDLDTGTAGAVIAKQDEPQVEVESDMPKNFPGRAQLIAAGHTTLEAVRGLSAGELVTVSGIKEAMAGRIIAARETAAQG